MQVTQVYETLNAVAKETLGLQDISVTDETGIVDVGRQIIDGEHLDKYVKKLVNHIGKVIFVNREYFPKSPNILKDSWEYGSILEKIDCDMPDSEVNETWELEHGVSYNQDKFTTPKNVRAKFFNKMVTFEVDISITDLQLKQSFSNLTQLNAFYSMIQTRIKNKMRLDYANLCNATINNAIGATIYRRFNSGIQQDHTFVYGDNSYPNAVNLLGLYKDKNPDQLSDEQLAALTAENVLYNTQFLKFASKTIALTSDRLTKMSTLFNIGNKQRFTDRDKQHILLLSEFKRGADMYLQSTTFHEEFTKLPEAETVEYWQGTGTDYNFSSTSKIHIKSEVTKDGVDMEDSPVEMIISGVVGVIFDTDALGVNNQYDRVPTHYNAKGEFTNYFYKSDARYFNDYDENFVVFFVA